MYKILCQFCTARLTGEFAFLTGFSVTEKCDGCGRKNFLAIVKIIEKEDAVATFQVQSRNGMGVQIISAGSAKEAVDQYVKSFATQPSSYEWKLLDDGFHIIVTCKF